MTRNLKALGLSLVAAFAMSAVIASAAQAVPQFTAEKYPAALTAEQTTSVLHGALHKFEATGRSFTCTQANFDGGKQEGPTSTLEVTPTYAGHCTATPNLPVTVTHNTCKFKFSVTEKTGTHTYRGPVDVVCPPGKSIEVHVYSSAANHASGTSLCTLTIGSQTALGVGGHGAGGAAKGTNEYIHNTTGDVTVTTTVTKITYTTHGSVLVCGPAHASDGTYAGSSTARAYEWLADDVNGEHVTTTHKNVAIDATVSGE